MADTNSFLVLAECVDSRYGTRYFIGDTFDPPPTAQQASRLVLAGCLPEEALEAAKKADAAALAAAKKADAEARKIAEAEAKKGEEMIKANDRLKKAETLLNDARDRVAAARAAADKTAAEKAQADAQAEFDAATADLAALNPPVV